VRSIFLPIFALWICGQIIVARADTFPLADGASLTGDILTFNDNGITFRQADSTYTNVMWTKFSQDGLKQLAKNPKIKPLVEPFIEIPLSERPHKPEVKLQEVTRLERPAPQSLIGALFSSSVGLFAIVLIYAANIYAGFEIAGFRARPKVLVMGVSTVLPILGPIIFLAMPRQVEALPESEVAPVEADPTTFAVAGQSAVVAEEASVVAGESPLPATPQPAAQIFKRGQFTFNRRFLETKFAGFLGAAQTGAERNQTLIVKTAAGQFAVGHITSISANEMHIAVMQGEALQEMIVPFAEIQEMQIQPKIV
jgi:hypothetical protein